MSRQPRRHYFFIRNRMPEMIETRCHEKDSQYVYPDFFHRFGKKLRFPNILTKIECVYQLKKSFMAMKERKTRICYI